MLLGVIETAERLGVSPVTIRRRIADDRFGGKAVRVGRRWRIPEDALDAYNVEAQPGDTGPHWMRPPEEDSIWVVVQETRLRSWVEDLVRQLKPDFIVVGVRKGERIVSVLKLIPSIYRERVFHLDYFQLMPEEELRSVLENRTVLLLDDTMQRGRTLRHAREWFVHQLNGRILVHVACLFVRLEVRSRGQLEVPDVIAYQELDDPTYRLAAAELSCFHGYLWPLDENHPMVWVRLPGTIQDERLDTTLAKLGRVLEMPAPVRGQNIRMLAVDHLRTPVWRRLGLPATAHDWPNRKLRLIWDKYENRLLIAGIWFPTLKATSRWLTAHHPSPNDPWYPYAPTQDVATWQRLHPSQRALALFTAWSIYCGVKLICAAISELLADFPEDIPSDIRRWNVEQEDFIRSYGRRRGMGAKAAIQAEIEKTLESSIQVRSAGQEPLLRTVSSTPVMQEALTIPDRVRPLVDLLKLLSKRGGNADFEGVSYEELLQELGDDTALMLDIALDYGFAKPTNRVSLGRNVTTVQRAYKDTERDTDPKSNSPDPPQLVERRITSAVHFLCHSFTASNPGDSLHQLAFNKFLVNLQANLSKGRINVSDRHGISIVLVNELAREFGPMAYTPDSLTPTNRVPIVSFLHDRAVLRDIVDDQEKSLPIVLTKPMPIERALMSLQEWWSPNEEQIANDIRVLCELHAKKTLGQGIPTKGNLLTALVACSSQVRYVYYSGNLVRMWRASAGLVMSRISEKVRSKATEAEIKPDLVRMLRVGASLRDKTRWYRTLSEWRGAIETARVEPSLVMARNRLLRRIEHSPDLDRTSACRSVMDVEPLVRLTGALLSFTATQAELVGDASLARKPEAMQLGDCFDLIDSQAEPRNFAEVCIMLRTQGPVEIEKAAAALSQLASLSERDEINNDVMTDLARVLDVVFGIISSMEDTLRRKGHSLDP